MIFQATRLIVIEVLKDEPVRYLASLLLGVNVGFGLAYPTVVDVI